MDAKERLKKKQEKQKQMMFMGMVIGGIVLIAAGAAAVAFVMMGGGGGGDDDDTFFCPVEPGDGFGNITHKVSDFEGGEIHFYSYAYKGAKIEYFLVTASNGKVKCAFNICSCALDGDEALEPHGYTQDGIYIKCNYQGCTRPINLINTDVPGCCIPQDLNFTMSADETEVYIQEQDIIAGLHWFV